ncbi:MAG: porin family protein [Cytophagaceae bacterium]
MKKTKTLITLILLAGWISAAGQTVKMKKDGGISIGPKAGASFTSFGGHDAGDVKARIGFAGGAFLNVSFLKVFSVQPEILFHEKGATNTSGTMRQNIRMNYIDIPVLFKLRLPIQRTFFPHIFAGPDCAYLVNEKNNNTDMQTGDQSSTGIKRFHHLNTGGVMGAGLDVQSGNLFFTLDGRYGFSFNSVGDSSFRLDVYNRNITVLAGIGIRFAGKEKE